MFIAAFNKCSFANLIPSEKDKKKILKAIKNLKPGGNTDNNAGLGMAYQLAQQHYKTKVIGLFLLITLIFPNDSLFLPLNIN